MITNPTQLEVALHQLTSCEEMLEAMRCHLEETNPSLFPLLSKGYQERIRELQAEISEYLRECPTEVPLRMRLPGPVIQQA
jgi:hypothetical protein